MSQSSQVYHNYRKIEIVSTGSKFKNLIRKIGLANLYKFYNNKWQYNCMSPVWLSGFIVLIRQNFETLCEKCRINRNIVKKGIAVCCDYWSSGKSYCQISLIVKFLINRNHWNIARRLTSKIFFFISYENKNSEIWHLA